MPANIRNAISVGVMPYSLSAQFSESREYPLLVTEYRDGSSQRQVLSDSSRKQFRLAKRLSATELSELRLFYLEHVTDAFHFYPKQTDHDPTGESAVGRYLVRFDGPWNESLGLGRSTAELQLVELA